MSIAQDYNTLKTNAFTFVLQRIPETTFRVTACNLPSITIPVPAEDPPGISQFWSGVHSQFEELTLRFIVDENMKNYREMYNWITMQRYAARTEKVPNNMLEKDLYSDGSLIVLTNAANPNIVFKFRDLFPVALSEISFDTTQTPVPATCQAVFRYSYFTMEEPLIG